MNVTDVMATCLNNGAGLFTSVVACCLAQFQSLKGSKLNLFIMQKFFQHRLLQMQFLNQARTGLCNWFLEITMMRKCICACVHIPKTINKQWHDFDLIWLVKYFSVLFYGSCCCIDGCRPSNGIHCRLQPKKIKVTLYYLPVYITAVLPTLYN